MNTRNLHLTRIALTIGAISLLGGITVPVRAQEAGINAATRPISLNLVNVPVQAALRTLFTSAGIRNYSIKSDVQGFANINISEVPFSLALRQLLGSVNPPLTFTVIDGTYMVSVQQPAPVIPPQFASLQPQTLSEESSGSAGGAAQPMRFYPIPIDHYDAYVIAQLLEKTTGIIQVPVNVVIPSAGSSGGNNGGNAGGGFGGNLSAPVTTTGNGNNSSFGSRPAGSQFGGPSSTGRTPFSIGQTF